MYAWLLGSQLVILVHTAMSLCRANVHYSVQYYVSSLFITREYPRHHLCGPWRIHVHTYDSSSTVLSCASCSPPEVVIIHQSVGSRQTHNTTAWCEWHRQTFKVGGALHCNSHLFFLLDKLFSPTKNNEQAHKYIMISAMMVYITLVLLGSRIVSGACAGGYFIMIACDYGYKKYMHYWI